MCLEENEPLRWVGTHRPDIKTIMLGDGSALVHRLPDLFRTPSIACIHEKSLDRILRLPQVLHLFFDSCTNATYYQTVWHGAFEETCAETSTYSGQDFLRGGAVITHVHSLFNSLGMERGSSSSHHRGATRRLPDTYYSRMALE
jgi:hypothetical protein